MAKEKKLKVIKILSIVVWIILLLIPTIVNVFNPVECVSDEYVYSEETDTFDFTLVFDKEVVGGEVVIKFYDENGTLLEEEDIDFETKATKSITVSVDYDDVPNAVDAYSVDGTTVILKVVDDVGSVTYIIALVYLIWLIYILSVNIASCEKNGKTIEVYAGFKNYKIKVDGEVVEQTSKVFFLKPIVLTTKISETEIIVAEIRANKKIIVYGQNIAVEETELSEEQKPVEEKTEQQEPAEEIVKNETTEVISDTGSENE